MLLIQFLTSFWLFANEAPPGCGPQSGSPGGCMGKSTIASLTVTPDSPCLEVAMNNCNGGVVDIRNNCVEDFKMGEVVIGPDKAGSMELHRIKGKVEALRAQGNYASYFPGQHETLEATGLLGKTKIKIGYKKSKKLCD